MLLLLVPAGGTPSTGDNTVTVVMKGRKFILLNEDLPPDSRGPVMRGTLAKPAAVHIGGNRIVFAGGSGITFYVSGDVGGGYLAGEHLLRAGRYRLRFRRGTPLDLHESGALQKGYLEGDQSLRVGAQRITLKGGDEEPDYVEFYPSGRLARGTLPKKHRLTVGKNKPVLTGDEYHTVEFSPAGRVLRGYLVRSQRVMAGDLPLLLECTVEFSENGRILRGVLSQDLRFRGLQFRQFQTVVFSYDRKGALVAIGIYRHPER